MNVASLHGITHHYGDTTALEAVDLDVPAGGLVGLIGPDGVGKSTLLGLLAGVRRLQAGTLHALDGDMASAAHRRAVCERIAYMPQGLGGNLYPTLSVAENVDFFGRLFAQPPAERRARAQRLLDATGLLPFADRPAGKLSGGMKQKLGLCCALIHDPDLLILDEPTTGVDPLSRRQFWALLDGIRERRPGMSVVVATAYMEEAERFDHLVAMHGGRVLATGTPAALRGHTGTQDLESAFVALMPDAADGETAGVTVPPPPADDTPVVIEAEHLTRRFGSFTAVDDVSFRIRRGEIFGFLGSNGCGKTTTMKMLTGLLPASAGEARVLGEPVGTGLRARERVGYMSQSFSLYEELTVRQNLALHARLFHLPAAAVGERVAESLRRFRLENVADTLPGALPLGVRQRLSLAVALIHGPELLILDEPTSGVDPVARDAFWRELIRLAREDGVTIFLSTHFMNEAARCDRISLMHAGRVLAVDTPQRLRETHNADDLETAFIAYLEEAEPPGEQPDAGEAAAPAARRSHTRLPAGLRRLAAFTWREALELRRDPIRLAFALFGPLLLMIAFGYGISFDVDNMPFAVLDHDRSTESRQLLEHFRGSRYFEERAPIADDADMERRLASGELLVALVIPPEYGHDLLAGNRPELGIWIDGAMPFRAETTRGYVSGVLQEYVEDLYRAHPEALAAASPATTITRLRYNQAFESANAITPGVIMLLLMIVPAMLTAVGVVREKEMGSITNVYATPTRRPEFLIGKQLPYVAVALMSFVTLVALALTLFGVPFTGSPLALILGAVLYVFASTGLGLLISSFVRSQVAALFAAAIITVIPSINFSGFMSPVSGLDAAPHTIGVSFPASWFQTISVGTFAKGLGAGAMLPEYLALAAFASGFMLVATALLPKQER
ncbi:ribosome-associated ATPase/putative transporter RbbA [Arhodomonas aquaeolei]|uniref:ribosome-associated ATPase/putative transporter RbbA n=1 Tax=Arhodomonas aquaeolei TaxID=2369 RepID=UPI0003618EEE|nr:ribosome-associated ATPase/putative transporter RbbA [Arhodomonas aquaeolei]